MSVAAWLTGAGAALAAGAAGVWWTRFARLLPAERALARAAALAERRGAFALALLRTRRAAPTPAALAEAAQAAADAFLERFAGVDLFAWTRRGPLGGTATGDGELLLRTGRLEAMEGGGLAVPEEWWDAAFAAGAAVVWTPDAAGLRRTVLRPWGARGRVWGLLGAASGLGEEDFTIVHSGALDELAAHLDACAERAAQLWELEKARAELAAGLDGAMRRLDETNVQLIRRAKEVRTFQEVTDAITKNPEHAGVLAAIVSIIASALEADLCAFLLLDEATGELVTQPGAFGLSHDEGALYRLALANDQSSSVRVFKTGEPFITADAQNDPLVIARYARLWGCHSLVVVPLTLEGRRIGVLRVGSFKKSFFTADHVQFVSILAEEAAVLVESAMLSRKLADSNRRLAEMHRIKDDFVSTVSHEFKTPLTSILGFLAVILEGEAGPLEPEQRRFLSIVRGSAQRLSELVSDILDLSKLEEGVEIESKPFDLAAAARKVVDDSRWRADEKGIELAVEAPEALPRALGSERWLSQVLENLLSNALKFSRSGGKVSVILAHKGEGLQATVADAGIGIPEADQPRIFEKFFRASNRDATGASGTGLGLAICRHIVDRHNGRIWFESSSGAGTRFHFVVPTSRAVTPAPEAAS
ncbi:MAG: GAF domain-containing sensor histidine kinase [Elusimicrobia bacterium]|nr:GAF domain-containing sensor histidine kinase [Elusimicrobiota bacterium]